MNMYWKEINFEFPSIPFTRIACMLETVSNFPLDNSLSKYTASLERLQSAICWMRNNDIMQNDIYIRKCDSIGDNKY